MLEIQIEQERQVKRERAERQREAILERYRLEQEERNIMKAMQMRLNGKKQQFHQKQRQRPLIFQAPDGNYYRAYPNEKDVGESKNDNLHWSMKNEMATKKNDMHGFKCSEYNMPNLSQRRRQENVQGHSDNHFTAYPFNNGPVGNSKGCHNMSMDKEVKPETNNSNDAASLEDEIQNSLRFERREKVNTTCPGKLETLKSVTMKTPDNAVEVEDASDDEWEGLDGRNIVPCEDGCWMEPLYM